MRGLLTVVELPEFLRRARNLLSDSEAQLLVRYERADLSMTERHELAKLVRRLIAASR